MYMDERGKMLASQITLGLTAALPRLDAWGGTLLDSEALPVASQYCIASEGSMLLLRRVVDVKTRVELNVDDEGCLLNIEEVRKFLNQYKNVPASPST